jgi:hypothetical protein
MFWGKDGAMRGNACGACRLLAALVCLVASAAPARSDVPPAAAIVTTRCLDCHDAVAREGGLSLEGLAAEITPETAAVWTKVLHELDTERMPPPDA